MAQTPYLDLREDFGRNYIINGDMQIAQRGTSFAAIANGTYSLDRWKYGKSGSMVHTISQDTDVPTFAQSGYIFQNSLRLNLTTADTAIASGELAILDQLIEGYNWASLAQKPFVLSFWVKATLPGIYCVALRNAGPDRSIIKEYTINAANTWEYKTVAIPASPSTGTWNYNQGAGLRVGFTLAVGSTFQTTANSWNTGNFFGTANQVNGVNTGATDFRITGVMINEGTTALPFRTAGKNFEQELTLCQRYYEKSWALGQSLASATGTAMASYITNNSPTTFSESIYFKVAKRTAPSVSIYEPSKTLGQVELIFNGGSSTVTGSLPVNTSTEVQFRLAAGGLLTSGNSGVAHFYWAADAEL